MRKKEQNRLMLKFKKKQLKKNIPSPIQNYTAQKQQLQLQIFTQKVYCILVQSITKLRMWLEMILFCIITTKFWVWLTALLTQVRSKYSTKNIWVFHSGLKPQKQSRLYPLTSSWSVIPKSRNWVWCILQLRKIHSKSKRNWKLKEQV